MKPYPKPAPKEKKKRKPLNNKPKTSKQVLKKQVYAVHREIVMWRDGWQCVLRNIDGGRCGATPQWGHVVAQNDSPFLRYSLSNVFCQCNSHNIIHRHSETLYNRWYANTFGLKAFNALEEAQRTHIGFDYKVIELQEMLEKLTALFENIPYVNGSTLDELIAAGYYGDIIKENYAISITI